MNEAELLDIMREAVETTLLIAAAPMLAALVVGLAISLFQALTQLQEPTIAFVPKVVAIFVSLIIFMPFMLQTLTTFTQKLVDRIVSMT